jgi:hypothetical protein
MSFTIEASRGILHTSSCFGNFRISLLDSIKAKIKTIDSLTNLVALTALKDIRLESTLISFITSPALLVALIPLPPVLILGAACISAIASPLMALAALVFIATIAIFLTHVFDSVLGLDELHKLSKSYDIQAKEAGYAITQIEILPDETTIGVKYKEPYAYSYSGYRGY